MIQVHEIEPYAGSVTGIVLTLKVEVIPGGCELEHLGLVGVSVSSCVLLDTGHIEEPDRDVKLCADVK